MPTPGIREAREAMALTTKQRRFAEKYLADLNASQAGIRAGCSKRTADLVGHHLLKHPEIAGAIHGPEAE